MDTQTVFIYKRLSRILIIMVIVFIYCVADTPSAESDYGACLPQSCGKGPNISYPFWILNRQKSHCGAPGFGITCHINLPVLSISSNDFVVKEIFYTNHSFLLASTEVYDRANACPIPQQNFSIEQTPFSYGPAYSDLFFLYYCTSPADKYMTYSVDCASNATHHSFAVFHTDVLEHKNYSIKSCASVVNAPVDGDDLRKLLAMNFTDILKKGFVLQWNVVDCSNCEKSGGNCGSHDNEFICFCNDQPHHKTCNNGNKSKVRLKIIIGFAAAGGTLLLVGLVFVILRSRKKKKHYATSPLVSRNISYPSSALDLEQSSSHMGIQTFSYCELEEATDNFNSTKELGSGGFGIVYKGTLRDGRTVAIKRLFESNYRRVEQFINEIEILKRMRHRNLVSLYGCTSRHCRELILVYEYIPNGTVADHLHGEPAKPGSLTWATRMNIAVDTAAALAYLHASDVIHRDVKTNNILLDQNFCVKVADFGLSRLFPTNVTHVSTAPQGTPGYVDPEYHQCYHLTEKSDVYSFGVVLFELISSMPAVDITRKRHEINLSNMAIAKIQAQALHELVDPSLGFESNDKVNRMISAVAELAFQCLHYEREMRPSMKVVLEGLKGIQKEDYRAQMTQIHTPADDDALLKSDQVMLSPDSVTAKWISMSTTSSSSS